MGAFNTEHIPVREQDATGPAPWTHDTDRYQVVFACGKAVFRIDLYNYTAARNRKTCRGCEREVQAGRAEPMEMAQPWHATSHTRLAGPDENGVFDLACGTRGRDEHSGQLDREGRPYRKCPGCLEATGPEDGHQERRRLAQARTAREVYRAIKTATSAPDAPGLVYQARTGREGFYRPDRRGRPKGDRILEDAGALMRTADRAVPRELRNTIGCQDGQMTVKLTQQGVAAYYFGINMERLDAGIHRSIDRNQPVDDGPAWDLAKSMAAARETVQERMPEATRHARKTIADALEPFGFELEKNGQDTMVLAIRKRQPE